MPMAFIKPNTMTAKWICNCYKDIFYIEYRHIIYKIFIWTLTLRKNDEWKINFILSRRSLHWLRGHQVVQGSWAVGWRHAVRKVSCKFICHWLHFQLLCQMLLLPALSYTSYWYSISKLYCSNTVFSLCE